MPEPGEYGVAFLFMPRDPTIRHEIERIWWETAREEGLKVIGWRDVPTQSAVLGNSVKRTEPFSRQAFIAAGPTIRDEAHFERKLFICRKVVSNRVIEVLGSAARAYYPVSASTRTVVYKGLVMGDTLGRYYPDLLDERVASALALVHQRFSTNTFPTWPLAHPYRYICHNGEINTLRGNYNWMAARQANMASEILGKDLEKCWPISYEGQSDSACFDNALELLFMGGYPLPHAMMMLIPEAWAGNPLMSEERRAFYEYHAALMEPWDGPAAMAFTDGRLIGATLDRNGLRPSRYLVTDDGFVLLASEMGVLDFPEEKIVQKWRLQPGRMLLIDLEKQAIISDDDLKQDLATHHPYRDWLKRAQLVLRDMPPAKTRRPRITVPLLDRQQAFGYTQEDLKLLMTPMAQTGQEAIGSMGNDTPVSALSWRARLLDTYFKQNFAQVTNPPIDPIREELVMSLVSFIGPRPNLLDLKGTSKQMRLEVPQPILTNEELERIRTIGVVADNPFRTVTIDITYDVANGADYMDAAIEAICAGAGRAVRDGYNIIILSDRSVSAERVPIPALLATSATHHHLIRRGLRTSVGLVVESGEPREVHQFCTLAGYGAEAINPYLAFETLEAMQPSIGENLTVKKCIKRYIKAVDKGILKVMSKMGISTYQSYCGAQIFDAVGLKSEFVRQYFTGTATQIEGVGLNEIAEEAFRRHADAFGLNPVFKDALDVGGDYAWRVRGEAHVWEPEVIAHLQHAVRANLPEEYHAYANLVNGEDKALRTLRGLFRIRTAEEVGREPVPLDKVEAAAEIVKRFSTGAMSFGSISPRGPYHARYCHEPHRRALQYRRGRRGGRPLQAAAPTAIRCARPSSRWPPAASASPPNIWSMPTRCRSRWRKGQSPARADSFPATRSTPPSHACATRPPASASSRRRRITTSIPSRTWRSSSIDLKNVNPDGRGLGEAGLGSGGRHSGRRRGQGARRPHHHLRLRRRHRGLAADLHQARRQPVGDRHRRDPADARCQSPAQPRQGAGGRRPENRTRRRDRGSAGRRRDGLCHRAADRGRLRDDAQVPPQHLPGRHRHPGPGAAQAFPWASRARHQLLLLHRRGCARQLMAEMGFTRFADLVGASEWLDQEACDLALEGARPRLHPPVRAGRRRWRCRRAQHRKAAPCAG